VKGWESSYLAGTAAGLLAKNGKLDMLGHSQFQKSFIPSTPLH